jgi:hypothetical protein
MWSEVLDQAAFTFSLGFPRAREARGAIEAPMRAFVMSRLLFVMSRLLKVADVRRPPKSEVHLRPIEDRV